MLVCVSEISAAASTQQHNSKDDKNFFFCFSHLVPCFIESFACDLDLLATDIRQCLGNELI